MDSFQIGRSRFAEKEAGCESSGGCSKEAAGDGTVDGSEDGVDGSTDGRDDGLVDGTVN